MRPVDRCKCRRRYFFNDIAGIVYTAVNFFLCDKCSSLCFLFLSRACTGALWGLWCGTGRRWEPSREVRASWRSNREEETSSDKLESGRAVLSSCHGRSGSAALQPPDIPTQVTMGIVCFLLRSGYKQLPWVKSEHPSGNTRPGTFVQFQSNYQHFRKCRRGGFVRPLCYGLKVAQPWVYYPGCYLEQDRSSHPQPLSCQNRPQLSWFVTVASVWLLALKCVSLFICLCLWCSVSAGLWCWLVLLGQPLAVTLPGCCPPACLFIDAWYFACCHSGYIFSFFSDSWLGCRLICCTQRFSSPDLHTLRYKLHSEFSIQQGCKAKPVEHSRNLLLTSMGHWIRS